MNAVNSDEMKCYEEEALGIGSELHGEMPPLSSSAVIY